MDILKREYYIALFDIYSKLLTKKQQNYFESYFFEDFSFSEIASEENVSRNAVFDQVKKVLLSLDSYEENLKFFSKKKQISELDMDTTTKDIILKILEE